MLGDKLSVNFDNLIISLRVQAKKSAGARRRRQDRRHSVRARHSRAEKKRVLCIVHYLLNKTGFLFLTALLTVLSTLENLGRGARLPRAQPEDFTRTAHTSTLIFADISLTEFRPANIIAQRNLASVATLDHCRTASAMFVKSKELAPRIPTH